MMIRVNDTNFRCALCYYRDLFETVSKADQPHSQLVGWVDLKEVERASHLLVLFEGTARLSDGGPEIDLKFTVAAHYMTDQSVMGALLTEIAYLIEDQQHQDEDPDKILPGEKSSVTERPEKRYLN